MSTLPPEQLRELARVYRDLVRAPQLLNRARMDPTRQPQIAHVSDAAAYWQAVNEYLSDSGDVGLRDRILECARADYPVNPLFGPATDGQVGQSWRTGGRFDSDTPSGLSAFGFIIGLDAESYGSRDTVSQRVLRDGLEKIFRKALRDAGIAEGPLQDQDRGDGFLGVVSSSAVPVERVVQDFVNRLRAALRFHNHGQDGKGRIRLRLALHQGYVIPDRTGWAGTPIVECARLLDADQLRAALRQDPEIDLVLIASDELYQSVIKQGFDGIDPRVYRRVEVVEKEFRSTAWLSIPERGISGVRSGSDNQAAGQPGASPGHGAGGPAAEPAVKSRRPAPEPQIARKANNDKRGDFLISAAPDDDGWGGWIAWYLKGEGYTVRLDSWDLHGGDKTVEALDVAVRSFDRTIAVLSPGYLASSEVRAAWQHAWMEDPNGLERTLIPVRVAWCEPAGLLRGIRYIDLVGLDEAEAKKHLKEQIRRSVTGNGRPTEQPPFPGRR
ncbi:toll/interleukin-1 receptor domain-containing protein [Pseudofrankia inefficax]|uniref:TIR domain-containing protein n=1 Tax=Pseudofrankia inefficax (strain DSM 45817 / CECT 9037 / DDB 130130 / EuI1c) TaxID=298654 RepID=E3J0G5_PSEI1|nr:toll/interleukin-1 receptor domain-containing protein [Pseudofrankia inefficax]ADP81594.1 hypothetical protein FraEuI1c_3587 [Pseudofrankia inefficax]